MNSTDPIFMEHKNGSVNSKKMNSTDPIFMEHKNGSINPNPNNELFNNIKKDYELIQKMFNENGRIESKYGELIQSRTKGAKNSTSRAYYFKTNYVREYLIPKINFTDNIKKLIDEVNI